MIDTLSESLKARQIFNCQHFSFMSIWNFILSWVGHEKLYNVQKSLKFRFTQSDYSVQSKWLPYLGHILAVRSMGNLDFARAVRMCRLFWAITGNLVSYQRPPLQAPLFTQPLLQIFCISVKSCALAEINSSKILMHTYVRTHTRTYVHAHTHVCTFYETSYWNLFLNYLNPRRYMGFRCLSHHMRAANAQTSLCIHAASPEPLLLSYTKQTDGCR